MTVEEDRLLAHVRAHVTGCTPQSLTAAGFSIRLVVDMIDQQRLARTPDSRIRYVHTDPSQESA